MTDISVADVTFIDAVSGKGCVQANDVINAIRPTTCLISVMLANNETGIIQVLLKLKVTTTVCIHLVYFACHFLATGLSKPVTSRIFLPALSPSQQR